MAAQYAAQFPAVKLATVEETFGGWEATTKNHFAPGGILEQVTKAVAAERR